MTTPTDPLAIHPQTGRPLVDKLPVPHITRWSNEANHDRMIVVPGQSGADKIAYADDPEGHERDAHGLLWLRDTFAGNNLGEPQWKAIHTLRARACSHKRRCQVCGGKFADSEPLTFVFNQAPDDKLRDTTSPFTTRFAPTCLPCAPWAAALCPSLRRTSSHLVQAHDVRPVGAWGEVMVGNGVSYPLQIKYGDPIIPMFLAKQPVLRIADYEELPMPRLRREA